MTTAGLTFPDMCITFIFLNHKPKINLGIKTSQYVDVIVTIYSTRAFTTGHRPV